MSLPSAFQLVSSAQWGCLVSIWNFLGKATVSLVPLAGPWVVACSFWWVDTQKSFHYLTHHGKHGSKLRTGDTPNYDDIWFYHISSHIFMKKKKRLRGILQALLQNTETQCLICAYRLGKKNFKGIFQIITTESQVSSWTIPSWHYLFPPPFFKREIKWGKLSDIIVPPQSSQAKGKPHTKANDGFLGDSCMVGPMPGGHLPVMPLRHLASWKTGRKKLGGRGEEMKIFIFYIYILPP